METKSQSPRDASLDASIDPQEATNAFTMLLHRNVERMANLQKTTLDVLNSQTADLNETMRSRIKMPTGSPAAAFLDFATLGIDNWVIAQKTILDLAVQQSANTANASDNHIGLALPSTGKLTDLIQQSIERTSTAQKTMLDFAATQNEAAVKAFQGQTGIAGSPLEKMADAVGKGVTTFVGKQKEYLDSATKITKEAVGTKAAGRN